MRDLEADMSFLLKGTVSEPMPSLSTRLPIDELKGLAIAYSS